MAGARALHSLELRGGSCHSVGKFWRDVAWHAGEARLPLLPALRTLRLVEIRLDDAATSLLRTLPATLQTLELAVYTPPATPPDCGYLDAVDRARQHTARTASARKKQLKLLQRHDCTLRERGEAAAKAVALAHALIGPAFDVSVLPRLNTLRIQANDPAVLNAMRSRVDRLRGEWARFFPDSARGLRLV